MKKCEVKEQAEVEETKDSEYCLVNGRRLETHKKNVFQLILEDFFETDTNVFPAVKEYFVTSGEAIAKIERLEKDAWKLAGDARRLKGLLVKARAEAKYLETGFDFERRLLLKKKNPRKRRR